MGRPSPTAAGPSSGAFLKAFALVVLGVVAALSAALVMLGRMDALPPPPLVATDCIDRKLAFLADQDLESVQFAAIGSSGAWRNLDMRVFADQLRLRPINAAPCYLQINQTTFLTQFLLPRMPKLRTVMLVALPRDFEACAANERAFFDETLAGAIMDGTAPDWLPYVTGFELTYLARGVAAKASGEGNYGIQEYDDGFGSNPLLDDLDWSPPWAQDLSCFEHLQRLETALSEQGVRLVVAFAPVQPEWLATVDPDQILYRDFQARVRQHLSPEVLIIPPWPEAEETEVFADTQHLRHPHELAFSAYVAEAIRTGAPAADRLR